MKAFFQANRNRILIIALYVLFASICCATQVMRGDDFFWYYAYEYDALDAWRMPNGRYLGNFLSFFIIRYPLGRWLVFLISIPLLLWTMGKQSNQSNPKDVRSFILVLLLFFCIPTNVLQSVIFFLSAYPNYVISTLCACCYLCICYRFWFGNDRNHGWIFCVCSIILGICGTLCLESMTVYSICFAAFAIIYAVAAKKKQCLPIHICYALAVAVGTVIMLTNENYHTIAQEDQIGYRSFEFSVSDIFMKLYYEVLPYYTKKIWAIHLIIFISFFMLYYQVNATDWKKERKLYAKLSMLMVSIFTFYSCFTNLVTALQETSWNMRINAFEACLTFLYVVAIAYLIYLFMPFSQRVRALVDLVSTLILSGIYCFVTPVSPRCFFPNDIFWILLAVEILLYADRDRKLFTVPMVGTGLAVIGSMYCYCLCMNWYANELRVSFLKEQLEDPDRPVYQMISLPYFGADDSTYFETPYDEDAENVPESVMEIPLEGSSYTILYFRLWAEYYGYDINLRNFMVSEITILDYNTDYIDDDELVDAARGDLEEINKDNSSSLDDVEPVVTD